MKYFLRKDASSQVEGPFDLDVIRGEIASGRFTIEYEAAEDQGQTSDQLRRSGKWNPLEEVFAHIPSKPYEPPPDLFLAVVRERSCYKNLRFGVDFLALAAWGLCIWWLFLLRALPGQLFLNQLIIVGLTSVGVAVLRLVLVLLADIGDVLIENRRR